MMLLGNDVCLYQFKANGTLNKAFVILPVFVFLSCLFAFQLNAQTENFVNYTTRSGLPSSQVYDIVQDDHGYIWFSTDKGLSRFNGYEFENFDQANGLIDNVVFDFFKHPNGSIWCTTNSGSVFSFEGSSPNFTNYPFNDTLLKYVKDVIPNGLFVDDDLNLYLTHYGNFGFLKIDAKGNVLVRPRRRNTVNFDYTNLNIKCLEYDPFFFYDRENQYGQLLPNLKYYARDRVNEGDRKGKFEVLFFKEKNIGIFASQVYLFIDDGKKEKQIYTDEKEPIASGKLNENEFWVGYQGGGVEVFDLNGNRLESFLPGKSVTQLFIDDQGNYWVSTLEAGVFQFDSSPIKYVEESYGQIISFLEENENNALVAGSFYGVITEYHGPENGVVLKSLGYASPSYIIVTSPDWLSHYFFSYRFSSDWKLLPKQTSTKTRYLLRGKSLIDVETDEELPLFYKNLRVQDIGYYNGQIYVCNSSGLYSTPITDQAAKVKRSFENLRVDDLNVFKNYLVLGTNGFGIKIINENHDVIYEIGEKDGLNSNYVTKTFSENDKTLWVCTNKGICRISFARKGKNYSIEKIEEQDGLLSNEVWDLQVLRDTIWVATQKGLNYFTKDDMSSLMVSKYDFHMTWKSIHVNDLPIENTTEFAYDQNKFEFDFLGMFFNAGNELEYRYKLSGLDKKWSYTNNRRITFSSLPAGDYKLIVQAKGKNNLWEMNQVQYSFVIHPPYWKTWWFRLILIVGIVLVVYFFFKIRVLTYNRDVVRDILRHFLHVVRRDNPSILIKHNGKEVKLNTSQIHFVKTAGNYLEVHTKEKTYLIRSSISAFFDLLPDSIEFLQVHRSYIIRLEHIQEKGKNELVVLATEIPVGRVYQDKLKSINLS